MQRLIRLRSPQTPALLRRSALAPINYPRLVRTMASEQAALHQDPVTGEMISKTYVSSLLLCYRRLSIRGRSGSSSVAPRPAILRRKGRKRRQQRQPSPRLLRRARRTRRSLPPTCVSSLYDCMRTPNLSCSNTSRYGRDIFSS